MIKMYWLTFLQNSEFWIGGFWIKCIENVLYNHKHCKKDCSPANLLVYGLFELLIVKDGPHLPIAVTCPVRSDYLHLGLANILPRNIVLDPVRPVIRLTFRFSPHPRDCQESQPVSSLGLKRFHCRLLNSSCPQTVLLVLTHQASLQEHLA